jgi:hypothetical protein
MSTRSKSYNGEEKNRIEEIMEKKRTEWRNKKIKEYDTRLS